MCYLLIEQIKNASDVRSYTYFVTMLAYIMIFHRALRAESLFVITKMLTGRPEWQLECRSFIDEKVLLVMFRYLVQIPSGIKSPQGLKIRPGWSQALSLEPSL